MRLVQLDVLRAAAVLLVIGHHLPPVSGGLEGPWLVAAEVWERCGWIGVDLFFVLSGFLVSGLLFREQLLHGDIHLGRFLLRRGLKIYPPFYCFLLAVVVYRLTKGVTVSPGTVLSELFFVQNYGPQIWGHTWSLAVEVHLYLLLGPLLLLLRRKGAAPFRALVPLFGLVAVSCLLLRFATAAVVPFGHKTHLSPTHLRLDSLFFGVLLSYLWHFHPARLAFISRARPPVLLGCFALIAPSFFLGADHFFMHTAGVTCLYVGFGGALLASLQSPLPACAAARLPLQALACAGSHSYSIYLWHFPFLTTGLSLVRDLIGGHLPYLAEVGAGVAGSLVVGILMAKVVEVPVVRLRDRLFASRSTPVRPTPVGQRPAKAQAASPRSAPLAA